MEEILNASNPTTILKDYNYGLLYINIDADQYEFKTNKKYYFDESLVVFLNEKQCKIMFDICSKHANEEKLENEELNDGNYNINKKKKRI